MSQKVRRLRQPRWNRVDLVHMGANYDPATGEGSHVVLFKAAPPEPTKPAVDDHRPEPVTFSSTTGNVTWTGAAVSASTPFVVRLNGDSSAVPVVGATIAPKASAESAPSPGDKPVGDTPSAAPAASTSTLAPSTSSVPVAAAAPAPVPSTLTPSTETQPDISKAVTDALAKQAADFNARLAGETAAREQVEKALREMREVEAERVFKAHAEQFSAVAPVDDLVPVLKAVAAAGEDTVTKFDEIMKAAAARVGAVAKWEQQAGSNIGLFSEVGTAKQANPAGGLGQLNTLAAEIQKAQPTLSAEQARARVLEQHPELYREYIADHPSTPRATR